MTSGGCLIISEAIRDVEQTNINKKNWKKKRHRILENEHRDPIIKRVQAPTKFNGFSKYEKGLFVKYNGLQVGLGGGTDGQTDGRTERWNTA